MWKDIEGFDGMYQVNEDGDVFSKRTMKQLKPSYSTDGYKQYVLYKDHKKNCRFAHRLVAEAFIPNPDNLPLINHKDEDKSHSNRDNLEWCDASYNLKYNDSAKKRCAKFKKKTYQYNRNKELVATYDSAKEAAEQTGFSDGNICDCAKFWDDDVIPKNGKITKSVHGFIFTHKPLKKRRKRKA